MMSRLFSIFSRSDHIRREYSEAPDTPVFIPGLPGAWHVDLPGEPLSEDGDGEGVIAE